MSGNAEFKSFQDALDAALKLRPGEEGLAYELLSSTLQKFRDEQTILHFETREQPLGPGRIARFDFENATVGICLLGDLQIRDYSFSQLADFGVPSYANPQNMGQALLGAFWEARITRRYLERIVANSYARLAPEEIDSFAGISEVPETTVASLCPLDLPESEVKRRICEILGNPFAQKDWGGETCDIFCNIQFRRRSVPAAFVLKGKSYANRPLRISDLGKNGDQLIRVFSLPAEVFVVQSNGPIDGAVFCQMQAQVAEKLMTNQPVYYLAMDGVQTARLLKAYGKL